MTHPEVITTDTFRISPQTCVSEVMLLYARRNLWWCLLPVAACITAGAVYDTRFFYISAMLIFLVIPMLSLMIYLTHALRPELHSMVRPHYVKFYPDRVETHFTASEDNPDEKLSPPATISYERLNSMKLKSRYFILNYAPGHYNLIIIPRDKFLKNNDIDKIMELIYAFGDINADSRHNFS